MMPNTDDHYQFEKKRGKKSSSNNQQLRFARTSLQQSSNLSGMAQSIRPEQLSLERDHSGASS